MYSQAAPESIQTLFGRVATRYDRANWAMSMGLHKVWNRKLNEAMEPSLSDVRLDLCCGTGDTSLPFLKNNLFKKAILLDFCSEMVEIAQKKSKALKIEEDKLNFFVADAQKIPLPDQSVDSVTVAYGIRNVHKPSLCIKEVYRVLKDGGTFGILELTRPKTPFLRALHSLHLATFLPTIGRLVTREKEAYSYLARSIQTFISPDDLERLMQETGFQSTYQRSLSFGLATLILATKK